MTIDYDCTEEDITALMLYFRTLPEGKKQSRQSNVVIFFMMIGVMMFLFGLMSLWDSKYLGISSLIGAIVAGIVTISLCYIDRKSQTRKLIANRSKLGYHKGLIGPGVLTLTPKGLAHKSHVGESLISWQIIEQVTETQTHLYLHFSPVLFFIIPKRAFATATQGSAFLKQIEEYRQAATGTSIPQTTKGQWWTQARDEAESVRQTNTQ
jgi:YcxB-like protein